MRRGDLVTIAISGDYGKPRPALIVQADAFAALPSVTVLQLTSHLSDSDLTRVTVRPDDGNNLRAVSQVMVDRAVTVPRAKVGPVFGAMDGATMRAVDRTLLVFLGLAAM